MFQKKFFVYSDTCPRRRLDASRISDYLIKNNYKKVNNPKISDLIIYVTCGFSDETANHAFKKIKDFKKYDAELIIAGCLPEIEKETLENIFSGKKISTKELNKIDTLFPDNKIKFNKIEYNNLVWENIDESHVFGILNKSKVLSNLTQKLIDHILKNLLGENSPFYNSLIGESYLIMVSRGCFGNCSYCAIKKAIGPLKSKSMEECINEFKRGLSKGYKKMYLVGDDLGAYGADCGFTFPELLSKIVDIDGEYGLFIMDLNPRWFVKYYKEIKEILQKGKVELLLIPIQSGSSRILDKMNRYSDIDKLKKCLIDLKKTFPKIVLVTHIMVGFPNETEGDFKESLEFVSEVGFNTGLLIPFSSKSGTKAADIEPKTSKKDINKRLIYAKKFLRNMNYNVIYIKKPRYFFIFDRE